MAQRLGLSAFIAGAQVQSLFVELRSPQASAQPKILKITDLKHTSWIADSLPTELLESPNRM